MSVRIGINPLTWTNDDLPELGDENSLESARARRVAGYEGVELGGSSRAIHSPRPRNTQGHG